MSAPVFIECTRKATAERVFINVADISAMEPEVHTTAIYMRSNGNMFRVSEPYADVIKKIADAAKFDPSATLVVEMLANIEHQLARAQL